MKVQLNNQIQQTNAPKFHGATDITLRYLATNQAIGANAVDLTSMVTPRTASDMIKRGPAAGFETLRREIMGTVNDTFLGLYGVVAGSLIAFMLNNKYGVHVNKIFTAPETLSILAENKYNQLKNNKTQLEYIKETLENVKAYNPTSVKADNEGYVKISKETIDEVSKYFDDALKNMNFKKWSGSKSANARNVILNKITENTGAQSDYILQSYLPKDAKGVNELNKITSKTNLSTLLDDMFAVSHSFNKDKVKLAFNEQIKHSKPMKDNIFIKDLSKFMKTRSYLGFAIASAVGLSVQPINMYVTKLKTGTDGFVGVEGRQKDKTTGFKALKGASSIAFISMVLATLKSYPTNFMEKMAFKGKMPTVNQLKGVYGITIISRICSARDKDELREVLTKDTLGYLSWLVLGDIVNKITADMLDKSVLNYKNSDKQKNIFVRAFNGSLKTRDEILVETLANNGISSTKKKDGKFIAKSFNEMLKDLDKIKDIRIKNMTKKRLSTLNKAQMAGYIFSGLVLGFGIPNVNIYVTNKLDQKRKAKAQKLQTAV